MRDFIFRTLFCFAMLLGVAANAQINPPERGLCYPLNTFPSNSENDTLIDARIVTALCPFLRHNHVVYHQYQGLGHTVSFRLGDYDGLDREETLALWRKNLNLLDDYITHVIQLHDVDLSASCQSAEPYMQLSTENRNLPLSLTQHCD